MAAISRDWVQFHQDRNRSTYHLTCRLSLHHSGNMYDIGMFRIVVWDTIGSYDRVLCIRWSCFMWDTDSVYRVSLHPECYRVWRTSRGSVCTSPWISPQRHELRLEGVHHLVVRCRGVVEEESCQGICQCCVAHTEQIVGADPSNRGSFAEQYGQT